MKHKIGLLFIIIAAVLAILAIIALVMLVVGIKEDALAAAPAILIAIPWSSFLIDSDASGMEIINLVLLSGMLFINPLIFYILGRLLRR